MKPVGDILPDLLRKQPQKHLPVEEMLRSAWAHLVGRDIAAHSHVFRLYRDTLTVHVPDRIWKRSLFRLEAQLLARINHYLGRKLVSGLDFRVDEKLAGMVASRQGNLFEQAPPPRKGPAQAIAPEIDPDVADAARKIADPELRELFLRTSTKMMKGQ